ncbi:MAG: hypothetical protein Q7S38_00355, partial [bacterium]|nr:hypothetical protein [bacterium]
MAEFKFLENPISKKWVILAPRRAKRPDIAHGTEPVCPFCPGREKDEQEVYRIPASQGEALQSWLVRVVPNKFPFAPIHEVIIHSPDHHKNFGELPVSQVKLILQTYRHRFLAHQDKGQVYIFHNRGEAGGESLPHPHTQLAVVPNEVRMDIPRLDAVIPVILNSVQDLTGDGNEMPNQVRHDTVDNMETEHFYLFCPQTSQWPDEVWVAPKTGGRSFAEITDEEISGLSHILGRLVQIFSLRHGNEFPFNFYIYPGGDWYLRLIPRLKTLGGLEIGTGIFVNTQDPNETIAFIREH